MSNGLVTDAPVLVTGATGFVASQVVEQLLVRGYRVRATVRDPGKTRSEGHLTALSGASERLELVQADLLVPSAFDEPVAGCEYVIHTASPYVIRVEDPQRDLVDPAVEGTTSVLAACVAAATVKRLVLTSSVAAISDLADGHVNTENEWNTRSTLRRNPYHYSKTMSERAVWDFVEANHPRFGLVALNPSYVIGPSLVPGLNTSHTFFTGFTNGRLPGILAIEWPFVDVRDVALAHVRAMENPVAKGRYVIAAGSRTMRQVVDLLRENGWGERYRLPTLSLDRGVGVTLSRFAAIFQPSGLRSYMRDQLGGRMQFDNSKARRELDMEFMDVDRSILDTMDDLERWGHLGTRR